MPYIKLKTSDGEILSVDYDIAKCSRNIRTLVEELGLDLDKEIMLVERANANIMRKIIQWATYHQDDPSTEEDKGTDNISSWDADFLRVDQRTLCELAIGAEYLDIKRLLDVICRTFANINMIEGKSMDEILFNMKSLFHC